MFGFRAALTLFFLLIVIVVSAVWGVGDAAVEDPLTLENIFEHDLFDNTISTGIHWLPDGSGFVYRDESDGVDGLWREAVVSGRVTLVIEWGDLSRRLAELRPGYVKPAMEDVNRHPDVGDRPVLSPDGRQYLKLTRNDLFLLDLDTGGVRYLTDTPQPELYATFSPDGTKVAFARAGDLHWVEVATGREHRLTDRGDRRDLFNGVADWVYEEELDVKRSFWWSPDGTKICFVQYDTAPVTVYPIIDDLESVAALEQQKYPKAGAANSQVRLGVVALSGGEVSWIPTGVGDGYIARAGWTPDGEQLWFELLNRPQNRLELRIATPGVGGSRLLVAEQDAAWVNLGDAPAFVDGQRFIWSSERDGWRHLYLYGLDGRLIRRLTSGEWQVEKVYGLEAGGNGVIFRANAEDYRERHIYWVSTDGTRSKLLTTEPGTHDAILSPGGRYFLDTYSDALTPPRLDLYDVFGRRIRTVDDGRIPALDEIDFNPKEFGTVATDDGETLYSWMVRPPDFDPTRRYPVLVYVYGGPGPDNQTVENKWDKARHLFFDYLSRQGLIVFSLDNRGTWGRGHAFEAVTYRQLGRVELEDQLAGVRHLRSLPYVDPDRIGVYGGSYGGYMVLNCMNRAPEYFALGIAYAPVSAWRLYDTVYTERYMGLPQENSDGYFESAPLNFASGLKGKLLICHGTMDNNVHPQNTIMMAEEYFKAGKDFELVVYPRVRHGIRTSHHKYHFHRLKTEFLEKHLIQGGPR